MQTNGAHDLCAVMTPCCSSLFLSDVTQHTNIFLEPQTVWRPWGKAWDKSEREEWVKGGV